MGRVLAASPRSANHTSPGIALIEQIEYFLGYLPGRKDVEGVRISRVDDVRDKLLDLGSLAGIPRFELLI